ncbi:transglycosylase domain-containing protein [Sphingomonas sp. 1P06PA]|uniref:transglycosylase domain-containing protein n=1 Tax=Sphingomonas sp. 1P06PA TaxID=554121 RepID=UPI0039A65969
MRYDDPYATADPAAPPPGWVDPRLDPALPPDPPARRRRRWLTWRVARRLTLITGLLFVALVGWLLVTAPLSRSLRPVAPAGITLLAADGQPIARRGAIVDRPVAIADLPKHVPNAFIAIEDRRFYDHLGLDPRGIARAAWRNTVAGGVREGGSTITQQLAKVAFLDSDRTAARKLREVLIAFWLEARLSKDEILQRYLSNVYFGDNVYGLRAASLHYFNRQPERLTVAQAAMLAGLLKAPSRLAPTDNLAGARARQKIVVGAMVDAGLLNAAEARRVRPAVLDERKVKTLPTGTYFADWALPAARAQVGAVYSEEDVRTTLDRGLQRAAWRAVNRAPLGRAQVALVAMRPDGEVVAMIGGRNYEKSPFNRATQARRQAGSTFKLFVYLAALRSGLRPDDPVTDRPLTIDGWSPRNSDGRYRGEIPLREAFARSSNVAAVRLAQQVGLRDVKRAARDLGVTAPIGDNLSVALGTSEISLLQLTSAYAALAADAYPIRAHGLARPEQGWLERVWKGPKRFDRRVREDMLELLAASVGSGTGRSAALRTDTFGKTGTTQGGRDAIFIGFAGGLVTGVWIGNDDNTPLPGGSAGGGVPARIWRDFMAQALNEAPAKLAPAPPAPEEEIDVNAIDIQLPEGVNFDAEIGDVRFGVEMGPDGLRVDADPRPRDPERGPPPPDEAALPPREQDVAPEGEF